VQGRGPAIGDAEREGWEWGRIADGGTMVMLPVLIFSFVVRRYLVHGLTGGALKA
jgi:multiple sugar transport system permease protein